MSTINPGDVVLHIPTGERWDVAAVSADRVICCGYPETMALAQHCHVVEAASADQSVLLSRRVVQECAGQTRAAWAREWLRARGLSVAEAQDPAQAEAVDSKMEELERVNVQLLQARHQLAELRRVAAAAENALRVVVASLDSALRKQQEERSGDAGGGGGEAPAAEARS